MCIQLGQKKSIKSANVMSLCMLRRHYIKSTICARHIMSLFFPGTFCNSPYLQAFAKQWQWCSPVAFCSAVRACWNNINNQTCGVLKTRLARTNFWNSERTMRIDTVLCFFLQRCWFCCADALHCCTRSATLFVVFLFLLSCNKQYPHRTVSPPGKTCRWWPSSQVFR